jgi:hypothetical protein
MSDLKLAARPAMDAALLTGDELAYRSLHDLMLDLGYNPDLAAAMIDVARTLRTPGRLTLPDVEGYQRALDAGIVEPTGVVIPDNEPRAEMLLWELERVAEGLPEEGLGWQPQLPGPDAPGHLAEDLTEEGLGWQPTGPLLRGFFQCYWWMAREDAQQLVRLEMDCEAVTLPRLPDGLYWEVNWTMCLLKCYARLATEGYQGAVPPAKYIEFGYC